MPIQIRITRNRIPELRSRLPGIQQAMADEEAAELANAERQHIDANGQVDTGALESSVYTVSSTGSTYAQAAAQARDANPDVELLPEVEAPEAGRALVALAVPYAAPQNYGYTSAGGNHVAGRPFHEPAIEQRREPFRARLASLERRLR